MSHWRRASPEENFWQWFLKNENKLYSFDSNDIPARERLFDDLAHAIRKVHPDLCFEFGPRSTKREFVISAGGIKAAFPAVVALSKAAPGLQRWTIIAFRPRRTPMEVTYGGVSIRPEDVEFTLLDNGVNAGILLFLPGMPSADANYQAIGYLMLDEAIGEYDVETKLGPIKMIASSDKSEGERYPLFELPRMLDQLIAQLTGADGKPS